jgi:hypothetical protein
VKSVLLAPVLLALALRLAVVAATDRVAADVERYQRVARHLLDVSWNPYETRRLYPYPPPWAAIEAAAEWFARRGHGSFPTNVKLPVLAADLLIVVLLGRAAGAGRASPLAAWLYAAHPVSLLVGGAHGQFEALPLLLVLLALQALARGRRDASALALSGAVALKSFPVLFLPFLAFEGRASARSAARYAALVALPVALLLLPFALADPRALGRELLAYGGVADFGWTGLRRGVEWLSTGALPRSEARFWPLASAASKVLFLAAWGALAAAVVSGRLRLDAARASLAAVLAFLSLYGLLSAQYLLWAIPLGLLRPARPAALHAAGATVGLVGFYLFLAPGVLFPRPLDASAAAWAGRAWVFGVALTLAASLAWLAALLRAGGWPGLRAAIDATWRPSNSPSRRRSTSSGATSRASSPGSRRWPGLLGRPCSACARV